LHDVKRVTKKYGNYSIGIDLEKIDDPKVIYELLSERLFDILDVSFFMQKPLSLSSHNWPMFDAQIGISHCNMSQVSSLTNMFAFLTLAAGKKGLKLRLLLICWQLLMTDLQLTIGTRPCMKTFPRS